MATWPRVAAGDEADALYGIMEDVRNRPVLQLETGGSRGSVHGHFARQAVTRTRSVPPVPPLSVFAGSGAPELSVDSLLGAAGSPVPPAAAGVVGAVSFGAFSR